MASLTLQAEVRTTTGKQVDILRRKNSVPAVVYGHHVASQPLSLDAGAFELTYRTAGATSLVDLVVGSAAPVKVLIHDVQRHPTTGRVLHADLYQVKMTEKLEADIELHFVGESPAVKELGGIFVHALDSVKVSCLPTDLVPAIEVDISALKVFEDRIHVRDLKVSTGITILDKGDEVVASVMPPRSEAEIASLSEKVEAVDVSTVEKVETKKDKDADEDEEAATEDKGADKKVEKKSDDTK